MSAALCSTFVICISLRSLLVRASFISGSRNTSRTEYIHHSLLLSILKLTYFIQLEVDSLLVEYGRSSAAPHYIIISWTNPRQQVVKEVRCDRVTFGLASVAGAGLTAAHIVNDPVSCAGAAMRARIPAAVMHTLVSY